MKRKTRKGSRRRIRSRTVRPAAITSSTSSDGRAHWFVPDNLPTGSDYKVKITSVDNNNITDFSDDYFHINGITDVEMYSSNIPLEYSLSQNFPNPFNPSTKIQFGLMETSTVSLRIYNITGQEVYTLLNSKYLPAGTYRYSLDASELPSGIYFYVMLAISDVSDHHFQQVKKMVLLK